MTIILFPTDHFTPLMAVCASSCSLNNALGQCLNTLIEKGVKIDAHENHGYTALIFACKKGRTTLVEDLIQAGSDLNKQDNRGYDNLFREVY